MSRYQNKHSPTHTHRGHQSSQSAFSIYYDPWHPQYSIHMLYSLFPQSLSKFSVVYLLAWYPPLHTPYISSPNHCLLFAAHAHTIALLLTLNTKANTHTHTTVLLLFWSMSGTTRVSRYQKGKTRKVKTNLDLLKREIVSGSGICWAICKSAPHPRQPRQHPTTEFFTGRMPFLPPNQQRKSTEYKSKIKRKHMCTYPDCFIGFTGNPC